MVNNLFLRSSQRIGTISVVIIVMTLAVNILQSDLFVTQNPMASALEPATRWIQAAIPDTPDNEGGFNKYTRDDNDDEDPPDGIIDDEGDDDGGDTTKLLPDRKEVGPRMDGADVQTMQEIQEQRRIHLRHVCESMGFHPTSANSSLGISHSQLDRIFVFPKYKLLYCAIPKVSCTSWKFLFLKLHGYKVKIKPDRKSASPASPHIMADRVFTKLSQMKPKAAKNLLQEYTSFVFVRNPYTRIMSAYNDKFVRLPVIGNWRKMARKWTLQHRPDFKEPPGGLWNVSFDEFVRYYSRAEKKNPHWDDMFSLCHPCHVHYNFVGFYETLIPDSDYILNQIGVPPDIRLASDPTKAQTNSSSAEILKASYSQLSNKVFGELSSDPGLRRDRKLFDYDIPEVIRRD